MISSCGVTLWSTTKKCIPALLERPRITHNVQLSKIFSFNDVKCTLIGQLMSSCQFRTVVFPVTHKALYCSNVHQNLQSLFLVRLFSQSTGYLHEITRRKLQTESGPTLVKKWLVNEMYLKLSSAKPKAHLSDVISAYWRLKSHDFLFNSI